MVLPKKACEAAGIQSGDILDVQPDGDGRIVLVRLERPSRKRRRSFADYFRGKGLQLRPDNRPLEPCQF
jgi:bifunctional DNA-binding transcriptional regulator/antitoxin component of YhaV-PrlF toxin-antitoxin module